MSAVTPSAWASTPRAFDHASARTITGRVVRILHPSDLAQRSGPGFLIARLRQENGETITVKGAVDHLESVREDGTQRYRLNGDWKDHERHGLQFDFVAVAIDPPATTGGMLAFLAGHFAGVSKSQAQELIDAFGEGGVLDAIRGYAEAVRTILGGEAANAASCHLRAYDPEMFRTRAEVFRILRDAGEGAKAIQELARELVRLHGDDAPRLLREDPFSLFFSGPLSFGRADALWSEKEGDLNAPVRRLACFLDALDSEQTTWFRWAEAKKLAEKKFGGANGFDFRDLIGDGIERGVIAVEPDQVEGGLMIAPSARSSVEKRIAVRAVSMLDARKVCWSFVGRMNDLTLSQSKACDGTFPHCRSRIVVLTGSPGTGKTFLAARLIANAKRWGLRVLVVAPSAEVAEKLGESLRRHGVDVEARTIHAALGIRPNAAGEFVVTENLNRRLDYDLVVVDEASMVDAPLFAALVEALRPDAKLLLAGDDNQLPSVGYGRVLNDLIEARVPTIRLTEQMRSDGSPVAPLVAAYATEGAGLPVFSATLPRPGESVNGSLVAIRAAQMQWGQYIKAVLRSAESRGIRPATVQFLAPMNWMCDEVNRVVQSLLSPEAGGRAGAAKPLRGDRVVNDDNRHLEIAGKSGTHFVPNGAQGVVTAIEGRKVRILLAGGVEVVDNEGFDHWALAYCLTVHKAQGREWPFVVFMLEDSWKGNFLDFHMAFTAISRASKDLVLLGDTGLFEKARGKRNTADRLTLLRERIEEARGVRA